MSTVTALITEYVIVAYHEYCVSVFAGAKIYNFFAETERFELSTPEVGVPP